MVAPTALSIRPIILFLSNPNSFSSDIAEFKSDFQTVKYAIKEGPAYPDM